MNADRPIPAPATILVIDDEPVNLKLLSRILDRSGYTDVHTLDEPRAALATFEEIRPDLLLLDLHMPHVDGFEILGELPELMSEGEFLPVLVLTADASPETRRRALSDGATDFLLKPLDPVEVTLRVGNLLHTRLLHRSLREERDRLEERVHRRTRELREANEALVVANRVKTDFISMASHEMRTPLTVLKGFTEVLLQRGDDIPWESRRQQLEAMLRNTSRLERLVNDLLLSSRIEASRDPGRDAIQLRATTFDINQAVQRAVSDAELDPADVTVDCPEMEVKADEGLVEQMVVNLLTNADKYGAPPIEISCSVGSLTVEIVVRDHGPGVPEGFVPELFDRFAQHSVGDRRTATGVGLGLWVVRGLAQLHGGDVTYEPGRPDGACFRVQIQQFSPSAQASEHGAS
ncbi:MAG: response regulator [Actinobacteria bacterium]|nr:response regulator [Actinomycetota bacterium]